MRRSFLAVVLVAGAACVEIPPNIHAQFAGPRPEDRSNYRPGQHGAARPAEELDVASAPADAGAPPVEKASGTGTAEDGGAP